MNHLPREPESDAIRKDETNPTRKEDFNEG